MTDSDGADRSRRRVSPAAVLFAGFLIWLTLEAVTRVIDLAHRAVVVIVAAVVAVAVVRVARGRRS